METARRTPIILQNMDNTSEWEDNTDEQGGASVDKPRPNNWTENRRIAAGMNKLRSMLRIVLTRMREFL
jgi:hypothetical protein